MKKTSVSAAIILAFSWIVGALWAADRNADSTGNYLRIVSLAPSVTETLFALGLGDRVVGVTRYCRFPPEALTKAKVGGYYDPNYEEIVRLRPDLVIMLAEHEAPKKHLQSLQLATLAVSHGKIAEIIRSITIIGERCGAGEKAGEIVADINRRIEKIKTRTRGLPRPRVLVSVGHGMGSSSDLCVAGRNTYYEEILLLAGGVNAIENKTVSFPLVSAEGIYQINPQVIIDLLPETGEKGRYRETILAEWNKISAVDAVRNKRVYLVAQDYAFIPGPRFIAFLEAIALALHPEDLHGN